MSGHKGDDWEKRYQDVDTPWDVGKPSTELRRILEAYDIPRAAVLEVGCGTGTNCVYLAGEGFDVTGTDVSPTALAAARERSDRAGVTCRWIEADLLQAPDLGGPYDFIFDRGCFHVVRQTDESAIPDVFRRHLKPGGWLLVLTGNANESMEMGPPPVSDEELKAAFADEYEIVELREFRFDSGPQLEERPLAWSLLLRKPGRSEA